MDKLQQLKERVSSLDEEIRRLAVVELAGYPIAKVKKCLFQALGDTSWRVRKEAVESLSGLDISDEIVEGLIVLLRSQENAGLRNAAVEVLERLGARAVPVLQSHGNDPDQDVRKFIIDIMGSIADASFVPLLIEALHDEDPNVCAAAVENLGKIGDSRAIAPLLELLKREDTWLRHTILQALGRIGKPLPVSVLAPLADTDLLKKALYDCLGAVGGGEGVTILLAGLRAGVRSAREAAVCALDKVREKFSAGIVHDAIDAGLRELHGTPAVEHLTESVSAPDRVVGKAVVRILAIIGDERAAGALLQGCTDPRLRSCCLQAFKMMGTTIIPFLEHEFESADEGARCIIAYLCGELEFKQCVHIVEQGLLDQSSEVRKEAVFAAGRLGLVNAIPEIASLLDDADPDVRERAVVALARLAELDRKGISRIAERLAAADSPEMRRDAAHLFAALQDGGNLSLLMKDEDVVVRKTAVSVFADLKSKANAGDLAMALFDEDPEVRAAVASALGETGSQNAVDSLLMLLKDEDLWVRCAALKSLGKLKGDKALRAIEDTLADATGAVMIAAIEALGAIGGERATLVLEQALQNDDEEVVKTAMDLLSRKGQDWLDKYRDDLLYHPHWGVRNSFVRLMAGLIGEKAVPYLREALVKEQDDLVRNRIKEVVERYQ